MVVDAEGFDPGYVDLELQQSGEPVGVHTFGFIEAEEQRQRKDERHYRRHQCDPFGSAFGLLLQQQDRYYPDQGQKDCYS